MSIIEINKYLMKKERRKVRRREELVGAASPFSAEPSEKTAFSSTREEWHGAFPYARALW